MSASPIIPGQRVGHWQVISIDEAGKRATVQCRCREIRVIAIEALQDGTSTSCGCSWPTAEGHRTLSEARREQQRRKIFNWRLERGR